MQEEKARRTNAERSEAMRAALLAAARALFVERGYAETGTPEIVAAAGVTRGALYHHFADKKALFEAVARAESAAVAVAIDDATPSSASPREALCLGGAAFLRAMEEPGRTRLMLIDGPAVLGRETMNAIDAETSARSLRAGFAAAMREARIRDLSLDAVTTMVSAAYDRAALAMASGADMAAHLAAIDSMIDGVLAPRPGDEHRMARSTRSPTR